MLPSLEAFIAIGMVAWAIAPLVIVTGLLSLLALVHRLRTKLPKVDGAGQFATEVFPRELDYTVRRRRAAASERPGDPEGAAGTRRPSTARRLVGLALSGGGIRSATYNLGVLQGLHARGILRHVDYLSTVSGGGFIGSCFSTLLSRPSSPPRDARPGGASEESEGRAGRGEAFPLAPSSKATEWLRNHSSYLARRGALDWVRLLIVWMRGVGITWFAAGLVLLVAAAAFNLYAGERLRDEHRHVFSRERVRHALDVALEHDLGIFDSSEREEQVLIAMAMLAGDDAPTSGDAPPEDEFEVRPVSIAWAQEQDLKWAFESLMTARGNIESSGLYAEEDRADLEPILDEARQAIEGLENRWSPATRAGGQPASPAEERCGPDGGMIDESLIPEARELECRRAELESQYRVRELLSEQILTPIYDNRALFASRTADETAPASAPPYRFRWDLFDEELLGWVLGGAAIGLAMLLLFGWRVEDWATRPSGWRLALRGYLVVIALVIAAIAREFAGSDLINPALERWPLVLAAALGAAVLPSVVAFVRYGLGRRGHLGSSVSIRDWIEVAGSVLLLVTAATLFVGLQPAVLDYFHYYQGPDDFNQSLIALGPAAGTILALVGAQYLGRIAKTAALALAAVVVPALLYFVFLTMCQWFIYTPKPETFLGESADLFVFVGVLYAATMMIRWLGINAFSMHGFYRDRLAGAYLVAEGPEGEIVPAHDTALAAISPEDTPAPYHLINAVINLPASKDPSLRGRNSDFFLFSKYFVGGNRTGYCTPEALGRVDRPPRLMTAMAVSGAAAAPNMGTFTSGAVRALLTLLNVRMSYWLAHPSWARKYHDDLGREGGSPSRLRRAAARLHPSGNLFWNELFGNLHERSTAVNVSDGGHLENLGVYELLRRRCAYIIVGDGEADPDLHCGGLATLIRMARIDLGVEIEIDTRDMKKRDDGRSSRHAALARIRYPETADQPAETGYLLHLKSSLTGDEDLVIEEYWESNPLFPHESTADQFFDEEQFEAYRSLGYHIVDGLFDRELPQGIDAETRDYSGYDGFESWFKELGARLAPFDERGMAPVDVKTELREIQGELGRPELEHYFLELYPELRDGNAPRPEPGDAIPSFREVLALATRQLRVMEQIVDGLRLHQPRAREHPANRGWMTLFRRWATSASFRRAYSVSIVQFSTSFRYFCERALGLELTPRWEPDEARGGLQLVMDVPGAGGRSLSIGTAPDASHPDHIALDAAWDDEAMRERARTLLAASAR